jgi:DNA repair protein SbcC/Rad50
MKKTSDLKKFHQLLNDTYYELEKNEDFPNVFYQSFLSGESTLYQKSVSEIKTFHEDWIGTIESYFPSLDKITKNAKSGLRYDQEVTAIEKAKKTNSDSVRHLAANTHLIKEVRANNEVIPHKILTTQAEIEYGIYENRFIKTLIDRLFSFVNNRYNLVKSNVESYEKKHFQLLSKFTIRETIVDMNIDVTLKEDLDDLKSEKSNHALLNRISHLLKQVNGLRESVFMNELKRAKPVVPPIMKTQIILKNVDYKNCYILWLYLDKYNTLDFDIDVKEQIMSFDRYYMKNVNQMALTTFAHIYGNQKALEDLYQYVDVMEYKKRSPKIIKKNLDDIVKQPDPFVVEDTQINQYYLEQATNLFKEKLESNLEVSGSYDVGLRKALKDTIAISNALYQSYFEFETEVNPEDQIFNQLQKVDLDAEIVKTKDKAKVARIIREVKEIDYNNAIRLEKRMLKQIEKLDKELSKELKRKAIDTSKKLAIEEHIKLERQNLEKNQEILDEHLKYVSDQREMLASEQKEFQQKLKDEEKRIKEQEKVIIELEKKRARDQYVVEMKKIKDRQQKEKQRIAELVKKQRQIEKNKLEQEKARLAKKSKVRIKQEKEKIQESTKEKINEMKNQG